MDISVIIPVYNVEQYVAECIKSVMAQKNIEDVKVECLIVDDRGTDNSMEVVRETLRNYTGAINFRIITREANGGLSAARNSGIREAKGEYLYFLDSDDLITPDCLSTFWKQVCLHPGVDSIYGLYLTFEEDGKTEQPMFLNSLGIDGYCNTLEETRHAYFKLPVMACNRLISREWLQANDLYFTEGIRHEDNDWNIRAYYHIRSLAFDPHGAPIYLYRQRPNSIMSSSGRKQRYIYLSNIICSAYEQLPHWDANLTLYLIHFIFPFRRLFGSPKTPDYKQYFKTFKERLYKSDKCSAIHRLIFAYIGLGRPWVKWRVYNFLCSLIKTPV